MENLVIELKASLRVLTRQEYKECHRQYRATGWDSQYLTALPTCAWSKTFYHHLIDTAVGAAWIKTQPRSDMEQEYYWREQYKPCTPEYEAWNNDRICDLASDMLPVDDDAWLRNYEQRAELSFESLYGERGW